MTNTTIGNTSEFNSAEKAMLADLIRLSMGTASIVQFASVCGMSISWLSKALNHALKKKPTQRTLAKLAGASAVEGTSLRDFYNACGYDSSAIVDSTVSTSKEKKLSLAEAEREFVSSPAVMGVTLFLSAWMINGNNSDIGMNLYDGGKVFIVTERTSNFTAIGIVAFCQDKVGVDIMKSEIMARVFAALGIADKNKLDENAVFYLLTDSVELYQFCANDLPKLSSQNMVVLLSDEHHIEFCEQTLRLAEGLDEIRLPTLVIDQ